MPDSANNTTIRNDNRRKYM